MTVFLLEHDLDYARLGVMYEGTGKKFPRFWGKPVAHRWVDGTPVQFFSEGDDGYIFKSDVDFPYFLSSGMLICSGRAWSAIEPLVSATCERFRLNCETHEYYALNVLDVKTCFDGERSEYEHDEWGGLMVNRLRWKKGCYEDSDIFKIPEVIKTNIYVSERFKNIVEENNFTGLEFIPIRED